MALFACLCLLACNNGGGSGGGGDRQLSLELMPAPEQVTATATGPATIALSWERSYDADMTPATGYQVLRDDLPLTAVEAVTTFTDEGLTVDQEYCYSLTALNADGEPGDPSEPVCATPRHYIQLSGRALTAEAPSVVNLTFTARDQNEAPVTDLPASAFVLTEDGIDLDADRYFQHLMPRDRLGHRTPVVIAVDLSATMSGEDLAALRTALTDFVGQLSAAGLSDLSIALVTFDDRVQVALPLNSDAAAVETAIAGLSIGNPSCDLFGAMVRGCGLWEDRYGSDRITQGYLVLVTFSRDTAALNRLSEAVGARGNRCVYTIGIGAEIDAEDLDSLATKTSWQLEDTASLPEALDQIAGEIQAFPEEVYLLRYASPKREGRHQIQLRLKENTNTTPGARYLADLDAEGFESVQPELAVRGPAMLTVGESVPLTAEVHWVHQSPDLTWQSEDTTTLTVAATDDGAGAQVTGVAQGQTLVTVTDTVNGLSARHMVGVDRLPLTAVGRFERTQASPCLSPGESGQWDDHYVRDPDVVYESGTFHMWYSGHNGASFQIGYAFSDDGQTWIRYGANPVLAPAEGENYLSAPSVVRTDDGTWHMWFSRGTGTGIEIGYAVSDDGLTWTRHVPGPVLAPTAGAWDDRLVSAPCVRRDGQRFVMWYSGYGSGGWRIGRAVSDDGIVWVKDPDPVVGPGEEAWNRYNAMEATVAMDGTAYAMWVVHSEGLTQRLGYYTSWDGIAWRAGSEALVLAPSGGDAWDAVQVGAPAALAFEDRVRLWYSGNAIGGSSSSGWQIGEAVYIPTPEIE
ncbi:MAG: VWA domain-containing protein [Desulfosarcinaceae bacterium]